MNSQIPTSTANVPGAWCILRTSPGRTLALADSLTEAGTEAWAPRIVTVRVKPRSTIKVEREMPIVPTLVFARAVHLPSLAAERLKPVSLHPDFSIFRDMGRIPLVDDYALQGFRDEEDRAAMKRRKERRRKLVMGQRVRFGPDAGVMAGLVGVVEEGGDRFVWIGFEGQRRPMKIATWLISPDDILDDLPPLGAAA